MATAAIKRRVEVACKLCRSAAVKTKGQWLKARDAQISLRISFTSFRPFRLPALPALLEPQPSSRPRHTLW